MGTEYGGNLHLGDLSSSAAPQILAFEVHRHLAVAGSLAWGPFIATTRSAIWRGGSLGHPR